MTDIRKLLGIKAKLFYCYVIDNEGDALSLHAVEHGRDPLDWVELGLYKDELERLPHYKASDWEELEDGRYVNVTLSEDEEELLDYELVEHTWTQEEIDEAKRQGEARIAKLKFE